MKKKSFLGRLFDIKMFVYDFVRWTGALPVLLDLRMKKIYITGKKPKKLYSGKYLVSANHASFIDPIILNNALWMRRIGFVATAGLFESKFWGPFFKACGCIEVDKENVSYQTFKSVQQSLDRGHIVGVFPEGGLVDDGKFEKFKSGIIMMAVMNGADILPMYIVKRKNRWHRQVVVVGEKFKVSDYITNKMPTMNEINEIANVLKQKEIELIAYYESYLMKKGKKQNEK